MTRAPRTAATPARIAAAIALGFSATVACAAVSSPNDARSAEIHPLTTGATGKEKAGDAGPPDGNNKHPDCPHGALEDPHRGFVRCLGPGEKSPFTPDTDGGAPPRPDASPDGGPPADAAPGKPDPGKPDPGKADPGAAPGKDSPGPDVAPPPPPPPPPPPEPPKPGPPPIVEMKAPKFENGEVPRAEKNLTSKKVFDAIAKCVSEAGGLTGKTGTLKVELLVRVRGRAEGVEVTPTGVSQDAAKCVRTLLKNRSLGTPTADPVGVTVVYTLKPASK